MRDMKQERQAQGLALVTPQPGWWEYLDKNSLPFRNGWPHSARKGSARRPTPFSGPPGAAVPEIVAQKSGTADRFI